jgi:hypothetical protein
VRKLAAAMVISVVLVLLPATAQAEWSRARAVDEPGWTAADQVSMAVARNGGALMAWVGWPPDPESVSQLRYRRISPSGGLGRVRTMDIGADNSTPTQISVALDDDGDALLAWTAKDHPTSGAWQVWARRLSRDGAVGPLLRLSDPSEGSWLPAAALTPSGRGAVIFDDGYSQVLYRISRGNRLSAPTYLPEHGGYGCRLAATRDGDFVTAGTDTDGVLVGYRLLPDGRLVRRKMSADTPMSDSLIDLGVDRRGAAYATYLGSDGVSRRVLWTRRWAKGGSLGPARRVAPRGHTVIRATSRTDLDGDTVITWSHSVESYTLVLYSRVLRRDGTFGPVNRLGPIEAADVFHPVPSPAPSLAVDDDGHGVVAWSSEPEAGHLITWARRIHRDGSVGSKVMLRDEGRPNAVGMTPTGRARVGITSRAQLVLRTGP